MKTFMKLCAALALFGCSSAVETIAADSGADSPPPTDVQPADVPPADVQQSVDVAVTPDLPAVDRPSVEAGPPLVCTLPNGGMCAAGSTCPAGDGCNDCTCLASGSLMCTARPCAFDAGGPDAPLTDAGATDAAATDAAATACTLGNGARCPRGMTCPAGDGCNDCTCLASGSLMCTTRPCAFDAGPTHPTCVAARDCRDGEECSGSMGCAMPWSCRPASGRLCTDDVVPYCGCDGRTFFGSSTCAPLPFASRGACTDGGV